MTLAGQGALVVVLVASIAVPVAALAVVLRLMWRSSRRHDDAEG